MNRSLRLSIGRICATLTAMTGLVLGSVLVSILGLALFDHSSAQARSLEARVFTGHIIDFQGPLQFRLSCCQENLALALVKPNDPSEPTARRIQAYLSAQFLSCTELFIQENASGQPEHLVWCHSQNGALISKTLLTQGDAVENCALSANQFGTC